MGKGAGTAAGNPVLWFSCVSAMFCLLGAKLLTFPESQIDGPGLWVGALRHHSWGALQPTGLPGVGTEGGNPRMQGGCLPVSQSGGGGVVVGCNKLTSRKATTRGLEEQVHDLDPKLPEIQKSGPLSESFQNRWRRKLIF